MNFSHPGALWTLPLAGLPWLIHLLSRREARHVLFSDLTLLRSVEAHQRPKSRLRDFLLLAARTLLLLALALAAAGPINRGARSSGALEGIDLVMLVDASYSMRAVDGARRRFDAARSAGTKVLREMSPNDRVAVGIFDDKPGLALSWESPSEALGRMNRAEPGWSGSDASSALAAAYRLLAASPPARRRAVILLGDGAAHMTPTSVPSPPEGTAVLGLKFPAASNAWISSIRPTTDSTPRDPKLEIRVAASGGAFRGTVDLWCNGRRGGSARYEVSAGGESRIVASLPPISEGSAPSWSGRAVLTPDALSVDDEAFFSFSLQPAPRTMVLYSDPTYAQAGRVGWFLRPLFGDAERSLAGREADFFPVARWDEVDFTRYGTVVLADVSRAPQGMSAALRRFVENGGGLLVIPGHRSDPSDFETWSWLPARFTKIEDSPAPRGIHVRTHGESWSGFDLAAIEIGRRYRLDPAPGALTVVSAADDAPLLVAGRIGRGRAVLWASALDASWTNLGLKPVFVAWATAALDATLPMGPGYASSKVRVGDSVARAWSADETAPESVILHEPDGRSTRLAVRGRRAAIEGARFPGLYQFEESGGIRSTIAVNLNFANGESSLVPSASPPWLEASSAELSEAFVGEVYGRDRRGLILGIAVLALVAEMLLSLPTNVGLRWAAAAAVFLLVPGPARSQQGDRFVWSQLRLGSGWDPYPDAPGRVVAWLAELTSSRSAPERRALSLTDPELMSSPFLYLAGSEAPAALDETQTRRLRQYLAGGGFLWIEDSTGGPPGSFDHWVRRMLGDLFPNAPLTPLPLDHALYRSFFLVREPTGRVLIQGALEGVNWSGHVAVLYTRNDLLGSWARDALGKPLKACVPGGETQREIAHRMTLNVLMYSMTGSYKSDAVHQAAILEKIKSGVP